MMDNDERKELINAIETINAEYIALINSREYQLGRRLINFINDIKHFRVDKIVVRCFRFIRKKSADSILIKKEQSKDNMHNKTDELNALSNASVTVYTCVTGGYDNIQPIIYHTPGFKYILITDNPKIKPCRMLNLHLENIATDIRIPRWCGAGKGLKSYDVIGRKYPCQMFTPLSNANVNYEEILKIDFSETNTVDKNCEHCLIYNVCPTCYGHNYSATGSISKRDKSLCELTKISTKAIAYLWFNKLDKYSREQLNISDEKAVLLIEAIEKIAKWEE